MDAEQLQERVKDMLCLARQEIATAFGWLVLPSAVNQVLMQWFIRFMEFGRELEREATLVEKAEKEILLAQIERLETKLNQYKNKR